MLVTGVSGSGKSSTVAAMVHHINRTQHKHVVTIENPIEFLHRDLSCSITQREVGVDTDSLTIGAARRAAAGSRRRGDRRDRPTPRRSTPRSRRAETGHLVIATMPTPDVVTTVERVLATLPREEREIGRMRFAEALRAIVSPAAPAREGREGPGAGGGGADRDAGGARVPARTRAAWARSASSWPTAASSSAPRPSSSTSPSWSRRARSPPRPPRRRSR